MSVYVDFVYWTVCHKALFCLSRCGPNRGSMTSTLCMIPCLVETACGGVRPALHRKCVWCVCVYIYLCG